jgi:hypothetical protein
METPLMFDNNLTAAKLILALSCLFTGCTIVPHRNTLTMDKVIKLDERAIEDVRIGIKLEWIR